MYTLCKYSCCIDTKHSRYLWPWPAYLSTLLCQEIEHFKKLLNISGIQEVTW